MKTTVPKRSPTSDALKAIYQSGRGKPDLSRLERRPRRTRRTVVLILVGALVLVALLALAGFFLFSREKKFSNASVQVTIDAPERLISGDEAIWTIHVTNLSAVAMTKTEVNAHFPEGFTFSSSEPAAANEFHNNWILGTVGANSRKEVKVVGTILGDLGSTRTMVVSVHYQPSNFSSDFVAEASAETTITTSVLDVAIKAPTTAVSGQTVVYTVTLKNTSANTVNRIRLDLAAPDGFDRATSEPEASAGTSVWDRDTLAPDAAFTVKLSGVLKGTAGQLRELVVRAGVVDANGALVVQRERSALILMLEPTLNVKLSSEDSSKKQAIDVGSAPKVTLAYSNDSDAVFTDVTLTLAFAGKDSSGGTIDLVESGSIIATQPASRSSAGEKLQWSKSEIADLARLVPGMSGSIEIGLPIKSKLRSLGSGKNFTLNVDATATAASVAGGDAPYEKKADSLVLFVNTELRLAAEARYFSDEGETLGTGPLPPKVGSTTTYQISWFITNTMNGAKDALLQATLPDALSFVSASESGGNSITYDTTTRRVRWQIAGIDAGVGQTLPTLTGTFTISLTPTDADLGTSPTILGPSTLTATDAFTGAKLAATDMTLTTELSNDPLASGKGAVVAASTSNTNTDQ